jgi:hypothetical protein
MPRAEDLTEKEIESIVSDVEAAVGAGKIRRVSNEEVMRTRLAALENTIAQFNRDLDTLYASKNMRREAVK